MCVCSEIFWRNIRGFSTDNVFNSPCLYMIDFGLILFLSVPIRVDPCYEVWHSSRMSDITLIHLSQCVCSALFSRNICGFSTENLVNFPGPYMLDFGGILFLSVPIRVGPCYKVWQASRNVWYNPYPPVPVCAVRIIPDFSPFLPFPAFQRMTWSTFLVRTYFILVSFSSLVRQLSE